MKLVRSVALVAVVTTVALLPSGAQANTSGHSDATGDVQSVTVADNHVVESTATPEPTMTDGDITSVRATNGDRAVKVVVRFAALDRTGDFLEHAVAITSSAKSRLVVIDARPGRWAGKATVWSPSIKKVACTVRHKIDYDLDKLTVTVPQSCLGHPKAIRVGARTFVTEGSKLFYDDGYMTGGWIKDLMALSTRIHR